MDTLDAKGAAPHCSVLDDKHQYTVANEEVCNMLLTYDFSLVFPGPQLCYLKLPMDEWKFDNN